MNKFFISLFVVVACTGHTEIQTTSSLEPIEDEIQNSPKETLLLLDIGGTLLAYPGAILHPAHGTWKYEWFQTHYPEMTKEEKIDLHHIIESNIENWELLNEGWPQVISKEQSCGAKVVAFTRVSKISENPSSTGSRSTRLPALGLHFKDDLPELSSGRAYRYDQGIIETDAPLKGPVLKEILSKLSFKPEKIIFVDDRIEQIQSVENTCNEIGMTCIAFHYVSSNIPELNEKVADYQLSTLIENHYWVSETNISTLLQ